MLGSFVTRGLTAIILVSAPVAAQGTIGAYTPTAAKYRITSVQHTSQIMMGQAQDFETTNTQQLSLVVTKAANALMLSMTLDSATVSSTAPTGAPDISDAIGMKFSGDMAPDGKVGTSQVTDKAGAPSTSQFASNLRSILPRLHVGAAKGSSWVDSTTAQLRQGDADVTSESAVIYTLTGDTVVAGAPAWKITGVGTTKLSGKGSRMGTEYTLTGTVKGTNVSIVSAAGVLLSQSAEGDGNLTVNVEAAGMTIPIVQHSTVKVEKQP